MKLSQMIILSMTCLATNAAQATRPEPPNKPTSDTKAASDSCANCAKVASDRFFQTLGLLPGDLIKTINGRPAPANSEDLDKLLNQILAQPQDPAKTPIIELVRDGRPLQLAGCILFPESVTRYRKLIGQIRQGAPYPKKTEKLEAFEKLRQEVRQEIYKLFEEKIGLPECNVKAWEGDPKYAAVFPKLAPFLVTSFYDGSPTIDDDIDELARFYKEIKYTEGTAFMELTRKFIHNDGHSYFMVFQVQTTDIQACNEYGSGKMADACFAYREFHKKYPTWDVSNAIDDSCGGLMKPDCVCGTNIEDVRKELKSYLKLDSSSSVATEVKSLLAPQVLEKMGLRLGCHPG